MDKESIIQVLKKHLHALPVYSSQGDMVDVEIKGISEAAQIILDLIDNSNTPK